VNFWELENYFDSRLLGTAVHGKYEQLIQSLFKSHLFKLGFEEVTGEPKASSDAEKKLIEASCNYNLPECLGNALKSMETAIESKKIREDACDGMKTADGATSGTQIEFRIHPISNLLK
jgi:hypothetical protein